MVSILAKSGVLCRTWCSFATSEPSRSLELRSAFHSSVIMSGISPTLAYLIGVPSIMIGSILLVGAIIELTIDHEGERRTGVAPRKKNSPVRVMPGFLRPWR
jgi:hypothetical protein